MVKNLSDRLLSWFGKCRKSKTLVLDQSQIMKAIDTVTELEKAILASSNGKSLKRENVLRDCS